MVGYTLVEVISVVMGVSIFGIMIIAIAFGDT